MIFDKGGYIKIIYKGNGCIAKTQIFGMNWSCTKDGLQSIISKISEVTIEFLVLWLVEMNHISR